MASFSHASQYCRRCNVNQVRCPRSALSIPALLSRWSQARATWAERVLGWQYIVNPNADECHDCPVGAVCNSQNLSGTVPGSAWAAEGPYMRLQECPRGFVGVRAEDTPASDACVACPIGKYSLVPANVRDGLLASSSTFDAASGALCNGALGLLRSLAHARCEPGGPDTLGGVGRVSGRGDVPGDGGGGA